MGRNNIIFLCIKFLRAVNTVKSGGYYYENRQAENIGNSYETAVFAEVTAYLPNFMHC